MIGLTVIENPWDGPNGGKFYADLSTAGREGFGRAIQGL
jgi:hypothetical protein